MEVNFRPETESRLQELANKTGRAPDDLVEDALASYLQELGEVRKALDDRYDELKNRSTVTLHSPNSATRVHNVAPSSATGSDFER
jgi:predicted DNA-binding protein